MNQAIQLLAATAGSFGFAVLFNLHGRKLALSTLGGLLAWIIYLLAVHFHASPSLAAFISSAVLTLYAEIMARRLKSPATIFLGIAIIPLVPGAALYRSVNYMLQGASELARAESLYTLTFAASMSAGITLTTLICKSLQRSAKSVS